ncbi:MAG: hypoxanthine phosphoribosyltransferase [Blastocatellia bacterium]|nr:hypoxanthine phosphoribosyltransferase [Chloracidobacterium sp.]MBL8185457.1 hypoxanthine phosphoribosyltransferase [Blastocatellia bacterium]HRJ88862.1 hypoxanthine phosphoribosyltransferase [Pyrinomonadaceae bacterium]HRK50352.1 hypoxanthine phosphoribosyltransferase [Pyrinomonadaceae bacterium]
MSVETTAVTFSEFTNPNLEVLYSADVIENRIRELGEQITADYRNRDLVLVGVLKGSCVFLADLMRAIDLPLSIDFMSVSSYKDGTTSTGDVEITKDLGNPIRGKDVLVVEDIVDTGLTLTRLLEILGSRGANSIRLITFLDKPEPRIKTDLKIDYTGFVVENRFVVGYGLDAAGRYRNLPFIGVVKDPSIA